MINDYASHILDRDRGLSEADRAAVVTQLSAIKNRL